MPKPRAHVNAAAAPFRRLLNEAYDMPATVLRG